MPRHPDRRHVIAFLLSTLLALVLGSRQAADADTSDANEQEPPPVVSAAEALPADLVRGPQHEVEAQVGTQYLLHEYRLKSPYGTYTVLSRRLLEIRVREIETMARVVGMEGAPEFLRSLGRSLAALPTAAVELVTKPGASFAKVRRGLGKTWDRIGDSFRHRNRTPYEDSSAENVFNGDEKRRLAAELGLDVYSTNPQVRRFLDDVANARAGGNLTVDLASFALPVVGYVAVTTAKWRADVERLLRDRTPMELDRYNAYVLMDLGIPRASWQAFLNHGWLSPRHRTVITATVKGMAGVQGLPAVLAAATTARSEVGALMQEQQAVLLSHHHASGEKLTSLAGVGHLVVGTTASGARVVFWPVDLVHWSPDVEAIAGALAPAMRSDGARRIHVTGRVTDRARAELERRGFQVVAGHRPEAEEASTPR